MCISLTVLLYALSLLTYLWEKWDLADIVGITEKQHYSWLYTLGDLPILSAPSWCGCFLDHAAINPLSVVRIIPLAPDLKGFMTCKYMSTFLDLY